MDYIEGDNLKILFKNNKIPMETKIEYLKMIGKLLKKEQNKYPYNKELLLSDIHEAILYVQKIKSQLLTQTDLKFQTTIHLQ